MKDIFRNPYFYIITVLLLVSGFAVYNIAHALTYSEPTSNFPDGNPSTPLTTNDLSNGNLNFTGDARQIMNINSGHSISFAGNSFVPSGNGINFSGYFGVRDGNDWLRMKTTDNGGDPGLSEIVWGDNDNDDLRFYFNEYSHDGENDREVMRLSPDGTVDVPGNLSVNTINGQDADDIGSSPWAESGSTVSWNGGNSSAVEVKSNYDTPNSAQHEGSILATNDDDPTRMIVGTRMRNDGHGGTQNTLVVWNNGDGGDRVGIGDYTPDSKLDVSGTVTASEFRSTSDRRFKKNITPLQSVSNKLTDINAVRFNWKSEEFPEREFSSSNQIGFIAQEVEKEFPELVSQDGDYKTLDYQKMTAVLLQAFKEQRDIADKNKENVEKLRSEIKELREEIESIK